MNNEVFFFTITETTERSYEGKMIKEFSVVFRSAIHFIAVAQDIHSFRLEGFVSASSIS